MHEGLLGQQHIFRLFVVRVVHTAIDRTNGRTLRLVVETYTLCALVRCDVIEVRASCLVGLVGLHSA
jgi:hypothetical protein